MTRFLAALGLVLSASAARAQQIDMSALPPRDTVQLTIYNSEDLTLVRETRHVTVRKGLNTLQFSWANTLIDPTSVELRFVGDSKGLELVDTRYPHDRPQALYWTVSSPFDGEAGVEISYFTSGISWSADYVGIADPAEGSMSFEGFVTVTNNSGEDYEDAEVRMVVGTINLVEKINDLAQRGLVRGTTGGIPNGRPLGDMQKEEAEAGKSVLRSEIRRGGPGGRAAGKKPGAPIIKEGLSEYFIFTVPGAETVKNGWSKRLRLFEGTKVPVKVAYRYRPEEYGDQLVRLYLVRNDKASTLGETPLPDGTVRLFRRVVGTGSKQITITTPNGAFTAPDPWGADGLSVVAFVTTKYVPIGQEFEFNLGRDPQVILERIVRKNWRDDFWFLSRDGKRLISPTKGERIEPDNAMSGWTDHEGRVERVRNYRPEPVAIEWRFPIDGDVTVRQSLGASLHDFRSPLWSATVAPGETKELAWELARKQGSSAKQNKVELATGGGN